MIDFFQYGHNLLPAKQRETHLPQLSGCGLSSCALSKVNVIRT